MNRLRRVRKQKGLTIKEVANEIGFSETRLHQYETEKREPKKETWVKLANYYDVPVSYLMGLPDGLVQHINKSQAMTFEELHEAIIQWAEDRNMIKPDRLTGLDYEKGQNDMLALIKEIYYTSSKERI